MRNIFLYLLLIVVTFSCKESSSDLITLDNGVQYQVIEKGSGAITSVGDYVYFDVNVTNLEGKVVFSSTDTKEPGVLKVQEPNPAVPNPIGDILTGKSIGDSIHVYIGKNTGSAGSGYDSLIYNMRLTEKVDDAEYNKRIAMMQEKAAGEMKIIQEKEAGIAEMINSFYSDYTSGRMESKLTTTESGLRYYIQKEGTGDKYQDGDTAEVFYYGILSRTGEMFDNSYKRGQPFSFPVGQGRVIKGWDEGAKFLNKGAQAYLVIPSELGYGQRGSGKITAGDELIFFIEVPE